ncbi:piggyBac transposable element-derived protein 5-like [Thalassophryne amazonica]|uniref:piggyBac transposable element-derived protein 5-like n=1 Tax=Thalassophryne amazonica TaxID=390379 RepID=UPI0014711876|nr:piggyBac transposable element-derived protein 5-like [Thalassophryne amazonica]
MAKRYSVQRALELIFDDDVEGEDLKEEVSEFEDHISENSESDSDSEEDDEIEHQVPKRRRATGPGRQQPATAPGRQQPAPGPSRQQPATRPEQDSQHGASEEIWMSKNFEIEWSSRPRKEPPRKAANIIRMQPGPTQMAVTHTQDIKSSFELFIPDSIQKIILDCTNLEGRCVFGERWKEMGQTHLHAYFGVLILAGVFRSKGESAQSLWDAETGREIFRATMSLEKKWCEVRGPKMDRKTQYTCIKCKKYICNTHSETLPLMCCIG